MVQTTGPIDSNVTLLAVESCGAFHGPARTNATKFEKTIKDGTIITDIVLGLLAHIAVHVVWCNSSKKFYVFIGVELCHLVDNCRLRALYRMVALVSRQDEDLEGAREDANSHKPRGIYKCCSS